jgi:DNA-binding transcriptional MerR regulator
VADNEKSTEAFRTISEVADELDLPQHVLRFWETRFAQIRPLKRGGGRRYYRPGDVELLRSIRHFLYGEGYTIKGVQRILREQGPRALIAMRRGGAPGSPASPAAETVLEISDVADMPDEDDTAGPEDSERDGMAEGGKRLAGAEIDLIRKALAEIVACQRLLAAARETGRHEN